MFFVNPSFSPSSLRYILRREKRKSRHIIVTLSRCWRLIYATSHDHGPHCRTWTWNNTDHNAGDLNELRQPLYIHQLTEFRSRVKDNLSDPILTPIHTLKINLISSDYLRRLRPQKYNWSTYEPCACNTAPIPTHFWHWRVATVQFRFPGIILSPGVFSYLRTYSIVLCIRATSQYSEHGISASC